MKQMQLKPLRLECTIYKPIIIFQQGGGGGSGGKARL